MLCHILGMREDGVAAHACIMQEGVVPHPWYEGGWYGTTCLYYEGGCCELRHIPGMRENGVAPHACIMQEGVVPYPWYEGGWYGSTILYYAGGCCAISLV
jgi:hypothetical protein